MFKFVTDSTSRVAEIESGGSDLTFEIPYEEFDRLKTKPGLVGQTKPVSDIAMIFMTDIDPMLDRNVRLAANHAIDKKAIVDRLLKGYGVPISTLEAPGYAAFDPSIKVSYDPELAKSLLAKSGYYAGQAGQVHDPDHARLQAERLRDDPGDRRHVAQGRHRCQYRGLRNRQAFRTARAPRAGACGLLQLGRRDRRSVLLDRLCDVRALAALAWKGKDLIERIGPLWGEKDEAKRIAGWKAVDKYIAEEGEVIPLFQYVQPIIHKKGLKVVAQSSGMILPQFITPA